MELACHGTDLIKDSSWYSVFLLLQRGVRL